MSRKLQQIMVILGALSVSSAAADGLSATLDVPVTPGFGVLAAINYSYELAPNWFVGVSLRAGYGPFDSTGRFSSSARLATNYIINLAETSDLKADAYVGAGLDIGLTDNFNLSPEVNAGARATFSVSPMAKVYGGVNAGVNLNTGGFYPGVSVYVGGKLEPITNLETYLETGLGYSFSPSSGFGYYDLKLGMYYTVIPEVRLGASVGYGGFFDTSGGFRVSIGAQFAQKPGTLATPGNFLP
jgi:hypothetical protein